MAWHGTGRYLCTASDDMTLRLWGARDGASLRTLSGHTNYVMCCTFSPQGNTLVRWRNVLFSAASSWGV